MLQKIIISIICFSFSISILSAQTVIQKGKASYYADKFDGRTTASGAIFRQNKMTAAHRKLPFGSVVRVTNLDNKNMVEVIVNDRGPYSNARVIDLSKSAARKLDFIKKGVVGVKVEVLSLPNKKVKKSHSKSSKVIKVAKKEYHQVTTKKVAPIGFGIQLARYTEAVDLIKRIEDIKNITDKRVFVQIDKNAEEKVYIIVIGPFATREKATDFNKKLDKKFVGSFVFAF